MQLSRTRGHEDILGSGVLDGRMQTKRRCWHRPLRKVALPYGQLPILWSSMACRCGYEAKTSSRPWRLPQLLPQTKRCGYAQAALQTHTLNGGNTDGTGDNGCGDGLPVSVLCVADSTLALGCPWKLRVPRLGENLGGVLKTIDPRFQNRASGFQNSAPFSGPKNGPKIRAAHTFSTPTATKQRA